MTIWRREEDTSYLPFTKYSLAVVLEWITHRRPSRMSVIHSIMTHQFELKEGKVQALQVACSRSFLLTSC